MAYKEKTMKLEIKSYGSLCELEVFRINGRDADYYDFGSKCDPDPMEYGCGNMQFNRDLPTRDVLEKYGISNEEYEEICGRLEECLSFGSCNWCE